MAEMGMEQKEERRRKLFQSYFMYDNNSNLQKRMHHEDINASRDGGSMRREAE